MTAPWSPREKVGLKVWLAAGAVFAAPEIWASVDSDLPIPTLSGTVGHLERRWEIASLFVILVLVNALLHAVRIGSAIVSNRAEIRVAARVGAAIAPPAAPGMPVTVPVNANKHVVIEEGRSTRTSTPVYLGLDFTVAYFVFTLALVAAGFLIPLLIHSGHATDAEKQLSGEFGYGAMGVTFFLIPSVLAHFDKLVPFPSLFGTVIAIEQRAQIAAVVVAGCLAFLGLHLALYPYPSIISWFVNLEHLHNYCVNHAGELICQTNKK
jgi:hypothetical protein